MLKLGLNLMTECQIIANNTGYNKFKVGLSLNVL